MASLNVCCGLSNPLPPVRQRAVEFCRRLEQADVDVVNFQEVWTPGLLRLLGRHLPSFPFVARGTGMLGQPAGGLASFSRTPLTAARYHSFRGTRPSTGSWLFRSALALSSRLQGVLTFGVSGHRTVVGNVHLTANRDGDWSTGNRHEALQAGQLRRVRQVLDEARGDDTELVIAGGDFNLPSGSALYEAMMDADMWRDPFAAADLPTFHAELLPAGATAYRVDYLLVHGDPGRCPVIGIDRLFTEPVAVPAAGSTFLSDHVAQVVRIAIS
ncbi:endonuclease/exonuclease/phosphatase family protein [Streptomyces sp. NBC_00285]|uniref:endonuclease/exonuclease/phosphatase family protein n=1 Tax=Streptomyces sp. NBC_00285 TaxID=2975700 RepID=UPI002E2C381D|nr:endonuclease/exonuclease/phosphatase family protein [Streptomyces sp. NBC_00285]